MEDQDKKVELAKNGMQEQWTRWEPIEGLAREYYIDSIIDNRDGLEIILFDPSDKTKKLRVFFRDGASSYRNINESYVDQSLTDLEKSLGTRKRGGGTLFKVVNSRYLKTLSEESRTLTDDMGFIHFCFLLGDNMLDVVDRFDPEVSFINLS